MLSIRVSTIGWSLAVLVAAGAPSCTSKPASMRALPEEPGEDPPEEQTETPSQELDEEGLEGTAGAAGTPAVAGAAGQSASSAGASASNGNGGTTTVPPGTGGATSFGGKGGTTTGMGGASAGGVPAGAGGTGGLGGFAGMGSGGASGAPVVYPPLTTSSFGRPTRVAATTTFTLAEGPLWDPCAHRLLFADVTPSKIYSLSPDGQIAVFATNTNNTNGIAFDRDGTLIMAQMGRPGHVSRRDKSGNVTPLDPPGSRLHTPDDVTVRSDGVIYFTDGDFPPVGGVDLAPLPVYALLPGATQLQNGGSVPGPNGIELSPDEQTLYVDAYFQGSVVKYTVMPDGTIAKGTVLASGLTNPDSLCLDAAGNLYVAVTTGLQVIRPDGTRVGLISVPVTTGVTNCTFGGDDGKTLYITAWTTVWQIPAMPIPGLEWKRNRERLACK